MADKTLKASEGLTTAQRAKLADFGFKAARAAAKANNKMSKGSTPPKTEKQAP